MSRLILKLKLSFKKFVIKLVTLYVGRSTKFIKKFHKSLSGLIDYKLPLYEKIINILHTVKNIKYNLFRTNH